MGWLELLAHRLSRTNSAGSPFVLTATNEVRIGAIELRYRHISGFLGLRLPRPRSTSSRSRSQ